MTPKEKAKRMFDDVKGYSKLPLFFKNRFIKRSCYAVIEEAFHDLPLRKERREYWDDVKREISLL